MIVVLVDIDVVLFGVQPAMLCFVLGLGLSVAVMQATHTDLR